MFFMQQKLLNGGHIVGKGCPCLGDQLPRYKPYSNGQISKIFRKNRPNVLAILACPDTFPPMHKHTAIESYCGLVVVGPP